MYAELFKVLSPALIAQFKGAQHAATFLCILKGLFL
jgi:hypothetical protein